MKFSNNIESILIVTIMILIIGLLSIEIFMRYVLSGSLGWSEEISRYLFIWFVYISMSYAITEDTHIRVEVLFRIVPESVKFLFKQIGVVLWIAFSIAFGYFSIEYVISMFDTGAVSGASQIPLWIISIGIPMGFILSIYRLLVIFIKNFKKESIET